MKKIVATALSILVFALNGNAQNSDWFFNNKSSVEIHIQKIFPLPEKETVKKISYQDEPVMHVTQGDEYTDFSFSFGIPNISGIYGTPESGVDETDAVASFRITPFGIETYVIPDGDCNTSGKAPAKEGRISIVFNNELVINNQKAGANGSITIDTYPHKDGDYLTGSFMTTLGDSPKPCEKKNLYKVWGRFNIIRVPK